MAALIVSFEKQKIPIPITQEAAWLLGWFLNPWLARNATLQRELVAVWQVWHRTHFRENTFYGEHILWRTHCKIHG